MKLKHRRSLLLCLTALSALGADGPTTAPAEKRTLLDGQIEYVPPAGWNEGEKVGSGEAAAFVSQDRREMVHLLVQPDKMYPDVQVARALIARMKEKRAGKPNFKFIQEPKLELSKEFEIRISEEYVADGQTYARLYLYRIRGKRAVSVTVTAVNAPTVEAKQKTFKTGEDVLMSVVWPKAKKK